VGVGVGASDFRPPSLPGGSLFLPPSWPGSALSVELLLDAEGGIGSSIGLGLCAGVAGEACTAGRALPAGVALAGGGMLAVRPLCCAGGVFLSPLLSGLVLFFLAAFFACPCEADFAVFVVAGPLLPASEFWAVSIAPMLRSNAPAVRARILTFTLLLLPTCVL
jgi:hypothetical protein